ncbi:CHAT domain-containing protein [Streptomyces sp. NPDC005492]|uniref:CHAT domain-containing protein n=1 Tax=Streptomyces sp. NPDC005492 TaxID=3156883 RepID=UPI0033B78861
MPAEPPGPRALGGAVPLGPGAPARRPAPEALSAPRTAGVPEHVAEPYEPVSLAATAVDPDARLPVGFAKLAVNRAYDERGQEVFWLTGHSGDLELSLDSEDTRLRPSGLALSNLRPDGFPPTEIFRAVAEWSGRQEDVVRWINELRARFGAELHLVIWDDTDYDIPWEMLRLTGGRDLGVDDGILGALVTVVRWTTIREAGSTPFDEPAVCSGHVLGYYAEEMRRDATVFDGFEHRGHFGTTRTFLTELARPGLGAGLVYMGCHATHGPNLYKLKLGTVTWNELNGLDMSALDGRRTLVCLNACHSARFVNNRPLGENALRGFAELFLRKGAGGCIATSGKVGDDVAHDLIRELVGQLCADPELPVARALRDFRAAAVARLPDPLPFVYGDDDRFDAEGQREILPILYSFMFLYFGHPLTTLRLSVRAQEART